jgi:hypothetical protein
MDINVPYTVCKIIQQNISESDAKNVWLRQRSIRLGKKYKIAENNQMPWYK